MLPPRPAVPYAVSKLAAEQYMFNIGMHIEKRTKLLSYIIAAGATANIGLNVILIPPLGMMGAAIASLLSYAVIDFLAYRTSQSLYEVPFELGRLAKILLVLVTLTVVSSSFQLNNIWLDSLARLSLMAMFLIGLAILGFWHSSEISKLKEIVFRLRHAHGLSGKLQTLTEIIRG